MKRWVALLLLVLMVASCAGPKVAGEFEGVASCVEYQPGMAWDQVAAKLGVPDDTPPPRPGTKLSKYTRGYRDMKVIFYTERKPFKLDGKIRFKDVVYKIKICRGE